MSSQQLSQQQALQKQQKWNERYRGKTAIPDACYLLQSQASLLPEQGTALDLACGLGGNAVFLARHGLDTTAWDFAANAIEHLNRYARAEKLPLRGDVRNVCEQPPEAERYDVIVVSQFLDRGLCADLISALKPRGLLYYQTFARDRFDATMGPQNPKFLLAANELPDLFSMLKTEFYLEGKDQQQLAATLRNQHFFIGRKV